MEKKPSREDGDKLLRANMITLAWKLLNRAERVAEKVDEGFAGEPFSRLLPAEHPKNIRRFRAYVNCLTEAFDLHSRACNAWTQAHGIAPEDACQWVERASRVEQAGAAAPPGYTVAGRTPTQILLLPEEVTSEHLQVAKQMVAKRVARNTAEQRNRNDGESRDRGETGMRKVCEISR
jgi:hypothetical protein